MRQSRGPAVKPTRLFFVRHGATELTAEDRFSGAGGVELSDEGRRASARGSADRLADAPIVRRLPSPLSRTLETARDPGGAAPPGADRRRPARDQSRALGGAHPAGGREPLRRGYAPGRRTRSRSRRRAASPASSVLARALPVIREIVVAHRARRSLVVSHKATLRLVLSSLLGFEPAAIATASTNRRRASTSSTSRTRCTRA